MTVIVSPTIAHERPSQGDNLHVIYGVLSLDLGGIERLVCELAAEHGRLGHRTTVVCLERRGTLAGAVETKGGEVWSLEKPAGHSTMTTRQAAELLNEIAPDVIHTHQVGALWYLGTAARKLNIPLLHTEHTNHLALSRGWWAKLKAAVRWRRSAHLANRLFAVSDDVAQSLSHCANVPRGQIEVIPNGIDLSIYGLREAGAEVRQSLGIPLGALVIGTVGRLAEVKRQDLLLRAFAALVAKNLHEQMWLLLAGDGPERGRLQRLAVQLRIARRVVFAGYQSEPHRFYQAMDLFVLSSRHEGLPLALLEAWAAGLPVVASAVGGIPKAVKHGETGMLFASGDEQALIQTLRSLLESPASLSQLGQQGRREVSNRYSLATMAWRYESIFRELVGQRERRMP